MELVVSNEDGNFYFSFACSEEEFQNININQEIDFSFTSNLEFSDNFKQKLMELLKEITILTPSQNIQKSLNKDPNKKLISDQNQEESNNNINDDIDELEER